MQQFERLLARMCRASAEVHWQAESSGMHTFRWRSERDNQQANADIVQLRYVWLRNRSLRL